MLTLTPDTRLVAFDLETTGLSAAHDRVVEIAAVCWQDGHELDVFQSLVNPGQPISPAAIAVHGITDAMVAEQPPIEDILPAFMDFCAVDVVIAHNAPFDLRFLRAACERTGVQLFTTPVVDTCTLARRRLPGCPNYRLETLKGLLGRGGTRAHRALQDARDCLALYLHCLQTALPTPPPSAITRPPEQAHLDLLQHALERDGTVLIEYAGGRGRITRRLIRPLQFDAHRLVVEAYCLLRQDTRHFYLDRIRQVWPGD